jgi:hypothetical protein
VVEYISTQDLPLFGVTWLEKVDVSQATIEERLARLEQLVDQLLQFKSTSGQAGRDDWKRTFGMFASDPVMKEIIQAGQRIREEDRRQAGT